MDGYINLAFSPPTATMATASGGSARAARPSMELTNTKETKAWEGLAIGAVTLARTFSTGSHRFCRSGSERSRIRRSRSSLPGALRRAFSTRRHPAGLGAGGDGYWRIHDMDGDSDRGDDTDTVEERGEGEAAAAEEVENKKTEQRDEDAAAGKEEAECRNKKEKKQRGGIWKACKKLFRL
ncbi:uncharacterized protein [Miscanthus floridulus]|uniref:uncharacterized protein n=1 Tax=Miscanthus floridulus TaxID=154761 RepID=UPI003458EF85